jgi:hypothetical protein
MRMPRAARVASGGEVLFIVWMPQVELLSPSQGFRRESLFQKYGPTVGLPRRALSETLRYSLPLHQFRVRTLNGTSYEHSTTTQSTRRRNRIPHGSPCAAESEAQEHSRAD